MINASELTMETRNAVQPRQFAPDRRYLCAAAGVGGAYMGYLRSIKETEERKVEWERIQKLEEVRQGWRPNSLRAMGCFLMTLISVARAGENEKGGASVLSRLPAEETNEGGGWDWGGVGGAWPGELHGEG
jgi:hypothetical protein